MNALAIMQTAQLIFSMIPIIIQAMQAVENAVGPVMPGAAKLEMVRAGLEAAYNTEQAAVKPFTDLWPALSTMIGLLKQSPLFTAAPATQPVPVQHTPV